MARNQIPQATNDEVAAFAAFLKKKDERERAERQARDDEARVERERVATEQAGERALATARERKEQAVRHMKRLQGGRFTFDERAEAEREYRSALGDLIALESGKRPEWSPAPVIELVDVVDLPAEVSDELDSTSDNDAMTTEPSADTAIEASPTAE